MVDRALLEQVMRLDEGTRLELRDAIEASVVDEHLTPDLARLLIERVAEDDATNWDEYVTLEDDERDVRARRRRIA
ncbi:hypothetical protein [Microbacterium sp.]|uniref:hypothetical protein n=1 Tax=Microbacterium sp. TaxID=51671 RepID=UPI003C73298E